jgi:predicted DNA-binding ribbon-helix-helix protein
MVRGRKPIAEREQVRDMRITLRLTQVEYRQFQAVAMQRGLSVGALVRALALTAMPGQKSGAVAGRCGNTVRKSQR